MSRVPVAPMMGPVPEAPRDPSLRANSAEAQEKTGGHESGVKETLEEIPIPLLTHIAPAIFVPLQKDVTEQTDEHPTRIDRAKRVLESVEFHKRSVRANFHHLVDHQKGRVLQNFRRHEQQQQGLAPSVEVGIQSEEADEIIDCMRAPPEPNVEYNICTDDFQMQSLFKSDDDSGTRPNTLRQLQEMVEFGVSRNEDYVNHHIGDVEGRWRANLEKEVRAMEGFGKPTGP